MRCFTASVLSFLLACSVCCGQQDNLLVSATVANSASDPQDQPPPTKQVTARDQCLSAIRSQDESIRKKLAKSGDLNYDETPWREIEEELEKKYGFNIVLSHSAKDDSLTADEPFTVNLTGIPLRSALRIILKQKNATYIIKDGVMLIVSLDDVEDQQYFSNFFINVRPLLATIAELEKGRIGQPRIKKNRPVVQVIPVVGQQDAANRNEQESITIDAGKQPVELTTAESLLLDVVQSSGDAWKETGQGLVTINIIGGYVVVNCNEEFADGLRDFLTDLNYHISRK